MRRTQARNDAYETSAQKAMKFPRNRLQLKSWPHLLACAACYLRFHPLLYWNSRGTLLDSSFGVSCRIRKPSRNLPTPQFNIAATGGQNAKRTDLCWED